MAFFPAGRSRGGGERWTPLVCSFGVGISPHESLRGELQVPTGRPILKNKSKASRAEKLEVSPNRHLELIMAGEGMLNYEPHRTLPTVPYGPSWFSGMIEEQAKRQMSSVRDYSTCPGQRRRFSSR